MGYTIVGSSSSASCEYKWNAGGWWQATGNTNPTIPAGSTCNPQLDPTQSANLPTGQSGDIIWIKAQ